MYNKMMIDVLNHIFFSNLTMIEVILSHPKPDIVSFARSSLSSYSIITLFVLPLLIFYLIISIKP
jgi:hypothetical protein